MRCPKLCRMSVHSVTDASAPLFTPPPSLSSPPLHNATPPRTAPRHATPATPHSSYTNRLITAKDHAAVQINVGNVDPSTGRYTGEFKTFALCGYIRNKGEGDMALSFLMDKAEGTA